MPLQLYPSVFQNEEKKIKVTSFSETHSKTCILCSINKNEYESKTIQYKNSSNGSKQTFGQTKMVLLKHYYYDQGSRKSYL